jgi:hypothetical protein
MHNGGTPISRGMEMDFRVTCQCAVTDATCFACSARTPIVLLWCRCRAAKEQERTTPMLPHGSFGYSRDVFIWAVGRSAFFSQQQACMRLEAFELVEWMRTSLLAHTIYAPFAICMPVSPASNSNGCSLSLVLPGQRASRALF